MNGSNCVLLCPSFCVKTVLNGFCDHKVASKGVFTTDLASQWRPYDELRRKSRRCGQCTSFVFRRSAAPGDRPSLLRILMIFSPSRQILDLEMQTETFLAGDVISSR
jgi:hypothetical protein